MSGRGGRGRGRGASSGSRAVFQKAAKEAGVDLKNPTSIEDITRPRLFPDFEWHSSGKVGFLTGTDPLTGTLSSSSVVIAAPTISNGLTETKPWTGITAPLINTSREIPQKLQASPFFVLPRIEPDVVRYGKRPRPLDADALLVEYMGETARSSYIPSELLKLDSERNNSGSSSSNHPHGSNIDGTSNRPKSLEELAAEEHAHKRTKISSGGAAEDDAHLPLEEHDLEQENDDEEEGDVDYTQNYYASDEDSDVGDMDGDEAVY
jgi:hypothetical protein